MMFSGAGIDVSLCAQNAGVAFYETWSLNFEKKAEEQQTTSSLAQPGSMHRHCLVPNRDVILCN